MLDIILDIVSIAFNLITIVLVLKMLRDKNN